MSSKDSGPSSSKKILRASNGRVSAKGQGKNRTADEDLHSGGSGSDLDDIDLRADEVDPNESGEEDADETPAAKRLRLAKLYLESIKEDIGASSSLSSLRCDPHTCSLGCLADGEVDAAEIDKELISARLKQDVLEHAGKLHLYVADSVRTIVTWNPVRVTSSFAVRLFATSTHTSDPRTQIHCDLCCRFQ